MLQCTKSGPDAFVIRHLVDVPITKDGIGYLYVPCEHLIEMSTLSMCLCPLLDCSSEVQLRQLLDDGRHVVVKVTTEHNQSMGVLSDDIFHDTSDPLRSLFEMLLFPWFEVAVEHLNVRAAQLILGPAKIRPCAFTRESLVLVLEAVHTPPLRCVSDWCDQKPCRYRGHYSFVSLKQTSYGLTYSRSSYTFCCLASLLRPRTLKDSMVNSVTFSCTSVDSRFTCHLSLLRCISLPCRFSLCRCSRFG